MQECPSLCLLLLLAVSLAIGSVGCDGTPADDDTQDVSDDDDDAADDDDSADDDDTADDDDATADDDDDTADDDDDDTTDDDDDDATDDDDDATDDDDTADDDDDDATGDDDTPGDDDDVADDDDDDDVADDDDDDDDDATPPAPACAPGDTGIALVEVEENPDSPLTVKVRFDTDEETTARVFYGVDDPCEYYVATDEPVSAHELTPIGLVPGTTYQLFVEAEGPGGVSQSEVVSVTMPAALPLPGGAPANFDGISIRTRVYCPLPERVNPNTLMLTNLLLGNGFPTAQAVAWDRFGRPAFTYIAARDVGGGGTVDVSLYDEDPADPHPYLSDNRDLQLVIGGDLPPGPAHARNRPVDVRLDGSLLHQGGQQGTMPGQDHYLHHAYGKVAADQYVSLEYRSFDWDRIVIHDGSYDPNGGDEEQGVVWSMDTEGLIAVDGRVSDGNVASYDADAGLVYYHARSHNLLLAVDVSTFAVRWVIGEMADTVNWDPGTVVLGWDALVDDSGLETPWFVGAHGHEVYHHPDDDPDSVRLLVHDNGAFSGNEPAERPFTRVIEYRLHLLAGEAEVVWAFPRIQLAEDDPLYPYLDYCNHHMGDVHPLPNGNVLVISGSTDPQPGGDGLRPRNLVYELIPDEAGGTADLAWWMEATTDQNNTNAGFYAGHPLEQVRGIIGDEPLPTGLGDWTGFPAERQP